MTANRTDDGSSNGHCADAASSPQRPRTSGVARMSRSRGTWSAVTVRRVTCPSRSSSVAASAVVVAAVGVAAVAHRAILGRGQRRCRRDCADRVEGRSGRCQARGSALRQGAGRAAAAGSSSGPCGSSPTSAAGNCATLSPARPELLQGLLAGDRIAHAGIGDQVHGGARGVRDWAGPRPERRCRCGSWTRPVDLIASGSAGPTTMSGTCCRRTGRRSAGRRAAARPAPARPAAPAARAPGRAAAPGPHR